MCILATICLGGALALSSAQVPAQTGGVIAPPAPFADISAIGSNQLAYAHGTPRWTPVEGNLPTLDEQQARQTFRAFGEIAATQMDVWWGTTGASLIAASVRAGGF